MKQLLVSFAILGASGCATCHQQAAPAGIPMAGMNVASSTSSSGCEAIPAVGIGWETVSFSIPKPRLFAVPKPQAAPQVVGIPILTGGPTMTMGAAPMMVQPQMMGQPQVVQQQYVQAQPQSQPTAAPQSTPQGSPQSAPCSTCQPGCAEGCTSHTQVLDECDALIRDISNLQQELCIETGKATIRARQ